MNASYLVEVKSSVFSETSLTRGDFDQVSNLSIGEQDFDDPITMEFRSREDAKEWINSLRIGVSSLRPGHIHIKKAHGSDKSEVDGYLLFMPES